MNLPLPSIKTATIFFLLLFVTVSTFAQEYEWRLNNVTYSSTDPDGAGPATGSVTFTMQIRLSSGTGVNLTAISTGYSWQSVAAMIPTAPGCTTASSPGNITLSSAFTSAGFLFNSVAQCNSFVQVTGGESFDRTAAGTLESSGAGINLGSSFTDAFTVTLWTLGTGSEEGGYGIINSSSGAAVGAIGSYALSDLDANEYVANSLTYTTPLVLGSGVVVPVTLKEFKAICTNNGTRVIWSTASEQNSERFDIERSIDGTSFGSITSVRAAGNSDIEKKYEFIDKDGGAYYYRLKKVDENGSYKYSDIVKVDCESKRPVTINLYPVPAKDRLTVQVRSDKTVATTLQILDVAGRVVRTQSVVISNGVNNFSFDVDDLSAGQYIIRSVDQQIQINKQFTIAR